MLKIRSKSKDTNTRCDTTKLAAIGGQVPVIEYDRQAVVDVSTPQFIGEIITEKNALFACVQISTMERMPKYYSASGSDFKLMTHLYDDATTMLEGMERGWRLNGL